jgi:hypothetical protein
MIGVMTTWVQNHRLRPTLKKKSITIPITAKSSEKSVSPKLRISTGMMISTIVTE